MEEKQEDKKRGFSVKELKKENFVVMFLIGLLLLIIVWPVSDDKTGSEQEQSGISDRVSGTMENNTGETQNLQKTYEGQEWLAYASFIEDTLEEVLSTMEGAGKVKVMVTLKASGESVVEKDVTTGVDASTQVNADGGSHNTSGNEKTGTTVYVKEEDVSYPYVKQVICPEIAGVVVSVQGGDSQTINKNITEAIQALFGIEAHKIKIIKMSSQ